MPSAGELILQNSTNEIDNPKYITRSDKEWAHEYAGIENILLHTTPGYGGNTVHATFDSAFLPLDDDEERRMTEPANPPNERSWRLETEADVEHWWHTEVSDVVLAAWARYPGIVQTCHTKPLSDVNIPENVDATYAIYIGNQRKPVVIGEMKRNLINRREWEAGNVTSSQQKLARELRGYADRYECPQMFCWDGETLLMLQFRATSPWDIRRADCAVDCWVIPITKSTCSLRYALYRLLVQGFRRCQAAAAARPIQADG
ncbi:hypothetical protein MYCTH_2308128 [Thermothelomyces thermophilus ATCC 42464]|uniref:Uncharacterized protein n=1 Tax=Thermothelomyces thermophilus (strain ATCC 42464 / BCRC 31852 / DSM 1799) TaxID=573729 RepID=G2QJB0_THET4|nr:uncharacterized protein MYCTH_2308128 [Thermothelomyces thermophilus ATCC 42464]AEO59667.1 hypothetical protein MYCTH_2308128 [Thermothelomyces thermophilus ATCC 42464]